MPIISNPFTGWLQGRLAADEQNRADALAVPQVQSAWEDYYSRGFANRLNEATWQDQLAKMQLANQATQSGINLQSAQTGLVGEQTRGVATTNVLTGLKVPEAAFEAGMYSDPSFANWQRLNKIAQAKSNAVVSEANIPISQAMVRQANQSFLPQPAPTVAAAPAVAAAPVQTWDTAITTIPPLGVGIKEDGTIWFKDRSGKLTQVKELPKGITPTVDLRMGVAPAKDPLAILRSLSGGK